MQAVIGVTFRLLFWAFSVSAAFASTAFAEVTFSQSIKYYDIGSDIEEKRDFHKAIQAAMPKYKGKHAYGWATGRVRYTPQFKCRRRGREPVCDLTDMLIKVHVKVELPEWRAADQSSYELEEFFECTQSVIRKHENRHAEIWLETGERMERRFAEIGTVHRDKINAKIAYVYKSTMREARRRQSDFDASDKKKNRYRGCWSDPQLTTQVRPRKLRPRASATRFAASRKITKQKSSRVRRDSSSGGQSLSRSNSRKTEQGNTRDQARIVNTVKRASAAAGVGLFVLFCTLMLVSRIRAARVIRSPGETANANWSDVALRTVETAATPDAQAASTIRRTRQVRTPRPSFGKR